jgi:hypothetical protein
MASYKLAMAALGIDSDEDLLVQKNISTDILAQRFISRSLVLDSYGLTSHAAATAAFGVEQCCSSGDSTQGTVTEGENVLALKELSIQLHHFKGFLYDGLLNSDSTFIGDWLGSPISDTISDILQSWVSHLSSSDDELNERSIPSSARGPIVDLLMRRIRPMSEGHFCLFQSCSHEELFDRLIASVQAESECSTKEVSSYDSRIVSASLQKSLSKCQARKMDSILSNLLEQKEKKSAILTEVESRASVLPVEDSFERAIVAALGGLVRDSKGSMPLLQMILEVASASLPTLNRSLRCLRSPMRLASLVVNTCTFFDNTYVSSLSAANKNEESRQFLPIMWLLLETTPTYLAAFDVEGMPKESGVISAQLDTIQDALSVCDLVQRYMTPPAVFLLLGDQSEREGCRSVVISSSDSSYIRLARRTYMKDLLTGCGFLVAGLSEVVSSEDKESTEEKRAFPVSSSSEVLTNMVSMGQALILRMCFEFGKAQEGSSPSRSFDGDESSMSWKKVAHDVMSLCSYFKPLSVPPLWAGHAFLQCLLHYEGVNADLKLVLKTIRDTEKIASDDSDESDQTLGSILGTLGVECTHIERLVLNRAVEIFNSVSSCNSDDLREVDQLLALLPLQSPCPVMASAVRFERALMELVSLLSTLQVDLLPLQLRLLSPADAAARLLEQRPQAYFELNSKGDYDELFSSDFDQNLTGDTQDILVRRTLLRDRPPPGARLVRILLALHPDSLGPGSTSVSSTDSLHTSKMEIYLELLFAAISMSDMEGAYCLCRTLLTASAAAAASDSEKYGNTSSSLPLAVLERISESSLLVVGMLEVATDELHKALRSDLLSLILASTPVGELERISSLWRQLPPIQSSSSPSFSPSADDALDADEINLSAARLALLDVIGKMLRNKDEHGLFSSSTLESPANVVASAGTDTSRLSDAVGHLLLVEDSDSVHALLEKLYSDLDKKLSSTLFQEKQGQGSGFGRESHKIDEALVSKVVSKGFSRNSAKRAVLATRGEGFKEALSWAVEHSRDEDFEFPIAETVKGALLSWRDESLVSFNPDSMKGALTVLADVSEMYQRHCSLSSPPRNKPISMQDTYPNLVSEEVEWCEEIDRLVTAGDVEAEGIVNDSAVRAKETDKVKDREEEKEKEQEKEIEIENVKQTAIETAINDENEMEKAEQIEITVVNGSNHAAPVDTLSTIQSPFVSQEQTVENAQLTEPHTAHAAATSTSHTEDNEHCKAISKAIPAPVQVSVPSMFLPPTATETIKQASEVHLASVTPNVVESERSLAQKVSITITAVDAATLTSAPASKNQNSDSVSDVGTEAGVGVEGLQTVVHVKTVSSIEDDTMQTDLPVESSSNLLLPPLLPSVVAQSKLPNIDIAVSNTPKSVPVTETDPKAIPPPAAAATAAIPHSMVVQLPIPVRAVSLQKDSLSIAIDTTPPTPPAPALSTTVSTVKDTATMLPPVLHSALTPALPPVLPSVLPPVLHSVLPPAPTPSIPPLLPSAATSTLPSTLPPGLPPTSPRAQKASSNTLSALTSNNSTVLKAHLASRLRGALDVAEDFTGIGVNAADLARSVANGDAIETEGAEEEIGGPCDQVFQVCRSLATHRRTAAFDFLPQLLVLLPTYFQTEVAVRAERLIFAGASPSSSVAGGELERAKWATAALRLLTYHTLGDPLTYTVCIPILYTPLNTRRTILLLAYLYKGLDGSNLNGLIGVIKVATDHLLAVIAVDPDPSAVQTTEIQVKEAARAIQRASTPEGVQVCIISYPSLFTPQTQSIPSLPLSLIPPPHPLSAHPLTFSHPLRATLPLLTPFTFLSLQVSTISDESSEERTVASGAASVSAALKQLQEDVAVLRRVSRIPDSGGVYAKSLLKLKSGMI